MDIITICTPYLPSILATGKNIINKIDASVDLSSQKTRYILLDKWNKRTKNIELCSIAVAKVGKEKTSSNINIGDGVVNLKSQLGGDFKNISSKYLVVYEAKEKVGLDSMDDTNNAHHSNTPNMEEVIEIIKNEIKL